MLESQAMCDAVIRIAEVYIKYKFVYILFLFVIRSYFVFCFNNINLTARVRPGGELSHSLPYREYVHLFILLNK